MQKEITKEALTLKKIREIKGFSRKEAAILLGLTHKTIEKMENGRTLMTTEKINNYLCAYGVSRLEFQQCLDGKVHILEKKLAPKRLKVIEHNSLRRMYKRLITKEVKVLKSLRKMKGFTQYQASFICGYSKPSIGHIENGRIELSVQKIKHIVESYGFSISDFEAHMKSEVLAFDLQDQCISMVRKLSGSPLEAAHTLLTSMSQKA